jgi:RNA recognition motif-containing protein
MLFRLVSDVRNVHANHQSLSNVYSISAQVIMRGNRSAGYGFVALSTAEAAQKAVEVLDKKQLDNRPIIVEIARPADQKESERRDRKPRSRRPGRRGSRAVPGEVTEAEANGEAKAEEDTAPAEGEAPKPKKKKKKSTVSSFELILSQKSVVDHNLFSIRRRQRLGPRPLMARLSPQLPPQRANLVVGGATHAPVVLWVKSLPANPPRRCYSSPISVST